MDLRRKIDQYLAEWKNKPNHKPVLITGIRQSGKTYAIKKFANRNYENIFYYNFMTNLECKDIFKDSLNVDDLLPLLSVYYPKGKIIPNKTLFIFDEIQDCPRARLSFKSFAEDKRFDVIGSGSYLGIKGYYSSDNTPIPVGYEEIINLHTLDYEEFLWANGYNDDFINRLNEYLQNKKPIPLAIHNIMKKLFLQYLCIGGFPEAVSLFIENHDLQTSLNKVKSISSSLKDDFGRKLDKNGNSIFNKQDVERIRNVFELIPSFLAKENKRYIVSKISKCKNNQTKNDAINYLVDSGIITKSYNIEKISNPLELEINQSQFKIFPTDIGLLVSLLDASTPIDILNENLGIGKGALYEGLVADSLIKNDISLYYFSNNSLEIDFVELIGGIPTILEIKSENGNSKAAKTVLAHPDHYGKTRLIKLTSSNIGTSNNILTVPYYLAFLLFRKVKLETEDLSYNKAKSFF